MTPELLGQYLDVMRSKGVMACGFELHNWAKISVTFEPASPDNIKVETYTEPGGWKGPKGLDESQFDEELP